MQLTVEQVFRYPKTDGLDILLVTVIPLSGPGDFSLVAVVLMTMG